MLLIASLMMMMFWRERDFLAMRLAYKQLSFSRYAYDGEDQCLSPLPHNGDLSEEAKEKSNSGKRVVSMEQRSCSRKR